MEWPSPNVFGMKSEVVHVLFVWSFGGKMLALRLKQSMRKETMEIALLQTDIAWGDREENLLRVEKLMDEHPEAQLFVLPEMFATGFMVGEDLVTEPTEGQVRRGRKCGGGSGRKAT